MAQETESKVKDQNTQRDYIGDDEVSELQRPPSFYQKVQELAERFAATRFGQFTIQRADRALKLIEDTTKWSLPQDRHSHAIVLERTLPWLPFLLLIIMLRLARIWLSVGALMIGNGPVSPTDVIYFIQTRRRKLHAIRINGLKMMRHRKQESSSLVGKSFTQKLSLWLSKAICRPGVQRENSGRQLKVEQPQQHQSASKRPREEDANEEEDHHLTINDMLNKYANQNSEDDSDYVPNPEEETESESSESESDTNCSDELSSNHEEQNLEKYLSSNGVVHNKAENNAGQQQEQEQDQKKDQEKIKTSNGSNDNQQTEVAQPEDAVKLEEWKSTPKPQSAGLMKTSLYNNAFAAVNTDHLQLNPAPIQSTSQPDTNSDSDSDSDNTLNELNTETACNLQTQSTIETLTPATSSEDIFYSPIGSPNNFNSCFEQITPLNNATIQTVATHSTPNSELDYVESPVSQLADTARLSISLANEGIYMETPPLQQQQQQQKQQQQQQQQRYRQHNSQRFRGRNRR